MVNLNVAQRIQLGTQGLVLDCVGAGNLWVNEDYSNRVVRLTREIMIRALAGTAPGDLEITVFDYNLRGVAAPFSALQSEHLLHILSSEDELQSCLESLKQHVQGVNNVIQGRQETLTAFRRSIGKAVEGYRLVVIAADLYMLDDRTKESLAILLTAGPAAGVSFVIVSPTDERFIFLQDRCQLIPDALESTLQAPDIIQVCDRLIDAYSRSVMDPVLFTDIEDCATMWNGDSTDGVTFSIGTFGTETVHITMGSNKEQLHNAIVTGAVGQGKSNLLAVIIHSMCQRYSPRELELYLLDFKEGVTLQEYSNIDHPEYLPHARALGLESDVSFGIAVLDHLYHVYERRMRLFKQHGVQNIKQYREKTHDVLPRIMVVIDEFQMMFDDRNIAPAVLAKLSRSTRLFRAAGIHFILASQTIANGTVLDKNADIFAQTPIRIAHRNSIRESEATLGLGNTAAADLHMGQAIVNLDYGAIASNRKVSVAWADDKLLSQLRHTWWMRAKDSTEPPYVFDGNKTIRLDDVLPRVLSNRNGRPSFLAGEEITVDGRLLDLPFAEESGRNIAILGAGASGETDDDGQSEADDGHGNAAIGILQNAVLSLALRNTTGNALFMICDMTDPDTSRRNGMPEFLRLITDMGFGVQQLDADGWRTMVKDLASGDSQLTADGDIVYLIGFSLDKITDMPRDFGKLALNGPAHGVHVLGWWVKSNIFESQLGMTGPSCFDTKILLRLSDREVIHFAGTDAPKTGQDNRALVVDNAYLNRPLNVIPLAPVNQRTAARIVSALRV